MRENSQPKTFPSPIPSRDFGCAACRLCSYPMKQRHRFERDVHAQLKGLYKLDNYHGVLAWLYDLVVILAAILTVVLTHQVYPVLAYLLYPLAVLVIGARQRAFATLLHESSHKTLAQNRVLNYVLGSVGSGFWIFQTWMPYRFSHVNKHHRYLGDPNIDPDIRFYISQGLLDNINDRYYLSKQIIRTLVGFRTVAYLRYLLLHRIFPQYLFESLADVPEHLRDKKRVERRLALFEYVAFVGFWAVIALLLTMSSLWGVFLLMWIVPYLTTFQVIGWFIEMCEHYPLTSASDYDIYMTRNRFGSPLENFLTGLHGERWHLLHHLLPGLPFWNLDKAHRILLTDETYRHVNSQAGGIFTRGVNGAPSILFTIQQKLNHVTGAVEAT